MVLREGLSEQGILVICVSAVPLYGLDGKLEAWGLPCYTVIISSYFLSTIS